MTPTERALDFDLRKLDVAFYADSYPVYDALRTKEPIRTMPDGSLFLTRYRDVQAVYRDPKTFSSDKRGIRSEVRCPYSAVRASHDEASCLTIRRAIRACAN